MKTIALTAAALLGLLACTHTVAPSVPAGARYVNMGSSFAAGSGTGASPPGAVARCYQSAVSYARLLAGRLSLSLDDVSCGGATSAHVLGAWNELPPQIDAVTAETRLVTITVGGNDLGFAGNLIAASCDPGEVVRVAGMSVPCPPQRAAPEDAYARLAENMNEIARQVAARAPQARLIFIQYVTLVPATQCPNSRLSEDEAAALRGIARRLAEITAHAAETNGASVLRVDLASAGHTPCDSDPWSVGFPRDYDETQGAPWHPNKRGMEAIAAQLEAALSRR
ncbi:MAG: SGNH/GDSL hydrolase family protein [Hyphomonadaceae bacterium]|nr:SGNH/GDSL hydrolase family protein [Hyphomonadaceae bacterium]